MLLICTWPWQVSYKKRLIKIQFNISPVPNSFISNTYCGTFFTVWSPCPTYKNAFRVTKFAIVRERKAHFSTWRLNYKSTMTKNERSTDHAPLVYFVPPLNRLSCAHFCNGIPVISKARIRTHAAPRTTRSRCPRSASWRAYVRACCAVPCCTAP